MSGGRVTDIYGATPFDDNVFLDWIGAPGGLADVSQIKKALGTSFINMTTGVIATLIDEVVDQIEDDEPTKVDMLRDFRDNGVDLQSLTEFATSFVIDTSPIPIMPTEMRNFVSDAIEKTGAAEVLRETSNGIKNWNQEFLARNDLALGPDEEPTLLYNIVSGGTSLLASLGLLLLTKNPQLAATVLGTVQQTQAYEAYMAAGEEADKALAMSLVEAAVVGWLEMVGQGVWLNNVIGRGSSPLRGALRGGAVNFQEEFSQAGAEEFFRKIGGINDNTMMESFGSMLGQGIVGGLSGSPLGAVTGPMEMKGIRKAVDGGDYREALAETVAGRLIDDTSAELEFRVDAMSGEAKTEAGKQLSGVFNQIIDIAKAFNDGVDIQEVYKTKEQQEAFVADIIDRAGKSRTRKLAQEKAGRLRVLREKEANILEKIGAESDAAEVFIESLADKFDAETSAADKVESLRELLDTTAGDPDFVADADTIFDAIVNQEIDVAEYEALIEELRNDQDFETILEGSSRYINIQKRANKLNKELEQVRSEMTSLKESDANIADIIGDEYIKIRGDVVEDIRQNQAVKSLVDGIRLGKKLSSDQISSVQSALTDGIKKLEGTGVSDKAIKSLLRRVAATKSPVRLQYIVNNLPTMLQSDIVRQSKQQSIKNTKAIIKKFSSKRKNSKAYSTLDAQVSDAVDTMRHAEKNLSKGVGRRAEGESLDEFQTRKRDVMRNRFAAYVSKIMNDPMPDNAKSVAIQYISSLVEEPSFVEQVEIEQMVKGLVGIGRDIRSEKMAQREAEIFDATKDVVDKNQSKTKFNPDKLATKIKEAFSQPGNILVKSYNTLLDQMNIRDNKVLGQLEDLNILNAENRTRNDDELLQMIKDTVGAKYFTNEYLKGKVFSRDEIKIGKGRMVEFLNTLDEATDLDTAKKNVLRYIQHRSGDKGFGSAASKVLRDNVRGAESISDLTSIVGRMPQDLRDSYAIDWTHGELMYWYMLLQNDDMRESIMAPWGDMAMSEELVAEIESSITENDKKLVDVLSKKYEEMYEKINDVYRRINGTNLQRVENYTPVSREAANGSDLPIDPVNDFAHYLSPSLTKLRNNNAIRIKDQDAVDVYLKHVRNAQHYIDYAEWFEKATRVIAGASRDIIDTHGMSAYQALLGHIQLMEKVQNIEMNTQFAPLKYFRKTFMLSTLGANPQIGVKQLTSIFAMADNMPTTDFVGYVNEFFENQQRTYDSCENISPGETVATDSIRNSKQYLTITRCVSVASSRFRTP